MFTTNIEIKYLSNHKKYGPYNPNQYLVVSKNNKVLHNIHLGHGSTRKTLIHSEYYDLKLLKKYKDGRCVYVERIKFGRYIYTFGFIAKKGSTEFHGKIKKNTIRLLDYELSKVREQREFLKSVKKEQGGIVTISKMKKMFGWCDVGIKDVIENSLTELDGISSISYKDFKTLVLDSDKAYIKKHYRADLVTLLKFVRAI